MAGTTQHDHQHLPALLRIPDVRRLTGLSNSAIYRAVQYGTFPRHLKLSERSSAWVEAEIREWITARIAERDNTPRGAA